MGPSSRSDSRLQLARKKRSGQTRRGRGGRTGGGGAEGVAVGWGSCSASAGIGRRTPTVQLRPKPLTVGWRWGLYFGCRYVGLVRTIEISSTGNGMHLFMHDDQNGPKFVALPSDDVARLTRYLRKSENFFQL
jgi:hypothetical protein